MEPWWTLPCFVMQVALFNFEYKPDRMLTAHLPQAARVRMMEFPVWTLMVLMTARLGTVLSLGSKLTRCDPTPVFLGLLGFFFLFMVYKAVTMFLTFQKKRSDQKV